MAQVVSMRNWDSRNAGGLPAIRHRGEYVDAVTMYVVLDRARCRSGPEDLVSNGGGQDGSAAVDGGSSEATERRRVVWRERIGAEID